ncbi:MAG: ATPase [Candidatus Dojkabacteria bacterium]|nr:MAG: ATPase [Candidatus Dojkabacteria bacterium]
MEFKKYGLTSTEVRKSRKIYGENTFKTKKTKNIFLIFLSQLLNPLVYVLFLAIFLNLILKEYLDALIISIVLIINSFLGTIQEYKAQNTLKILSSYIEEKVTAIRDGIKKKVLSKDLVVGDKVILTPGLKVPADIALIKASEVTTNESSLTGESRLILKQATNLEEFSLDDLGSENILYKGSFITSGVGEGIVIRVGAQTEFGKIAEKLVVEDETLTPLQIKIQNFAKTITLFVFLYALAILFVNFLRGNSFTESITLSIAVAVSAIPEALVISLTIVLALGMQRLLQKKALVRKMIVAETLGSITTLCIDKTGTLTRGEMSVVGFEFTNKSDALKSLNLNNNEINSVDFAVKQWLQQNKLLMNITPEFRTVFNSQTKYAWAINNQTAYFLGAPDRLIEKLKNENEKNILKQKIDELTNKGSRVVGIAKKILTKEEYDSQNVKFENLEWLGLIELNDPVRMEAKEALAECKKAGISIKIITGDYKNTAVYVMENLGIKIDESQIISGEDIKKMSDEVLESVVSKKILFYRIEPTQKYRIVSALQKRGERVCMMGDGINDAPALKKADIGVVVDNATDVSKDIADMVLLDSSFNTLVDAVEEGRVIFANMKKIITFLLSDSFSVLMLISGSFLLNLPLPLNPLQIIFINLIGDSFPDVGLAFEKKEKNVMRKLPKNHYKIFNSETLSLIIIIGFIANLINFAVFVWLYSNGYSIETIQSFIFLLLSIDSFLYVYSIRSLKSNIWKYNPFSNSILNIGVLIGFFLTLISFYLPFLRDGLNLVVLSPYLIEMVAILAFLNIFAVELTKYIYLKYLDKN